MKKIFSTIGLVFCITTAFCQFGKVAQPRELQDVYMFSTDNPDGSGHIEWSFHDTVIYKEYIIGGSSLKGGKVVKSEHWGTEKPFVFLDSAGIVAYTWQTDRGVYTIIYSDDVKDIVSLVVGWKDKKDYPIYDVVHFW